MVKKEKPLRQKMATGVYAKITDCAELKKIMKEKVIRAHVKDAALAKELEHALAAFYAYGVGAEEGNQVI